MSQKDGSTSITETVNTAAAVTAAEGTTGTTAAPAESTTSAGTGTAAPETAFADEDAELARLEKQAADEETARRATETGSTTGGEGTGDETTTTATTAGDKAATGAATATTADATAKAAAAAKDPRTGAIIALRTELGRVNTALAVKEGENRVLKTLVDPVKFAAEAGGDGATTVQPSAEEQEQAAISAERIRISEEVDAGRMTMREYAEHTNELNARDRAVTLSLTEAMVQANAEPQNDLGLQEHLGTVIGKYPVLQKLTAAQLKPFEQLAYDQAAGEGKPIQAGPIGTKDLRERMGALATHFYAPGTAVAATTATGTGATGSGQPVKVQPTAAQREHKLTLAGTHPADIGATGSGATGGEPTDAQAEAALAQGEDAAILWMTNNPGYVNKKLGSSVRLPVARPR